MLSTDHSQNRTVKAATESNIEKIKITELLDRIQPMKNFEETFSTHCKECSPRIGTGLLAFDRVLNGGLSNELYILNAETSTGKSAFMMHIAQKVAERGIDVLYFALEMGRDEFVARGISSISYEHYLKNRAEKLIKASDILYWTYDDLIKDFSKLSYSAYESYVKEYFSRYGSHLHIVEAGTEGITAKDIANAATVFKRRTGRPVTVFVDYLQLIKADPKDRSQSDRKSKVDAIVTILKALASQIGMPVMTISSVGRSSYNRRISEGSGKESGETEYTAGVLIGWNWEGVTTEENAENREKEKERCRERGFRHMTLDILKYRNSARGSRIHLKYFPAYSYFEDYPDWEEEAEYNHQKQKKRVRR